MFEIPMDFHLLEKYIINYEKEPVEKGKILFYGHSLFTRWAASYGNIPLEEMITMKDGSRAIVNHGFGTSTSEEQLYYYPRMVRAWEPRALVIATFANDSMYGYGPEDTMRNLAKMLAWARADFPGIKLFVVEPHPYPEMRGAGPNDLWNGGLHQRGKFIRTIHAYADTHEDTEVITLWDRPELFETPEDVGNFRKIREDIYLDDRIHPNAQGYEIYAEIFRQALDQLL